MVMYSCEWHVDSELSKGKGRAKDKEGWIVLIVLCSSSHDALRCLAWYFDFEHKSKYSFGDGEVKLSRMKIDSRGFHPHYLMLPGMSEPIYLTNIKENVLRLHKIFCV